MKALTLRQPWASLCVISRPVPCACNGTGTVINTQDGGYAEACRCTGPRTPFKTIETRSWPTPKSLIGQRIAIHAAKRPVDPGRLGPWLVDRNRRNGSWMRLSTLDASERLPLGAVVGTAVLADCVPMIGAGDHPPRAGGWLTVGPDRLTMRETQTRWDDVSDQRPFGHFEPGRWAWLLTDAVRFDEPIQATGRQGLWNWEEPVR